VEFLPAGVSIMSKYGFNPSLMMTMAPISLAIRKLASTAGERSKHLSHYRFDPFKLLVF
jgi:hypothetical protein